MTRARDLANIADGTFTATDLDLSGTLTVSGDATFDTNTLFVDVSANNVGIGTTSPSYKLDLKTTGSPSVRVRSDDAGGTATLLLESANTFSGTSQAYIKGIGTAGSGLSQLSFGTAGSSGDTSATERMRIDSLGRVGIGTPSPQKTLDVAGTLAISNSPTSYWDFDRNDSDGSLMISDTGSEKMRIDSSGNVGLGNGAYIGTLSSAHSLSIQGGAGAPGGKITLYGGTGSNRIDFLIGASEAARIDASGNFLVGTTGNPGGRFSLKAGANQHSKVVDSVNVISGGSESAVMAEGTVAVNTTSLGTVLSIPFYSQGSVWRRYIIEFMFSSGEYNDSGNGKSGTATVRLASLTFLSGVTLLNSTGTVSSVGSSGMNLQITFSSGFTGGLNNWEGVLVYYKVLSSHPSYFQPWNATLN